MAWGGIGRWKDELTGVGGVLCSLLWGEGDGGFQSPKCPLHNPGWGEKGTDHLRGKTKYRALTALP
jgi:hypothetical protein